MQEAWLTDKAQIQFLAEPFHRMFFLDNLAIGYPHAEVERVSVGTWISLLDLGHVRVQVTNNICYSMALHLRGRCTPRCPGPLGHPRPPRHA